MIGKERKERGGEEEENVQGTTEKTSKKQDPIRASQIMKLKACQIQANHAAFEGGADKMMALARDQQNGFTRSHA